MVGRERQPAGQSEGDLRAIELRDRDRAVRVTIGDGSSRVSSSYSATTCSQAVSGALGASVWTA